MKRGLKEFSYSIFLFIAVVLLPFQANAQKDTVYVPDFYDAGEVEGTLNDSIQAAIDAGLLSNTVFRLKPYGLYVLDGTVTTPPGEMLEILGPAPGITQETAPPMIAWTSNSAVNKRHNFDIAGQIKMKNVWILYSSLDGNRANTSLRVGDSVSVDGGRCEFENVIFDYSSIPQNASGAVEINARHFRGYFKNCYFRNCTDDLWRYYSRALAYRWQSTGLHADSVLFENCTFANIGYVLMQEGGEYGDNVHFNHCTFLNVVMYSFQSGWWYKMSVTNSIFVNTYMYGDIPEYSVNRGRLPFGGTINIDSIAAFGFEVPFDEQDRHILFTNSSYYISEWLQEWMWNCPSSVRKREQNEIELIPVPQPMLNARTIHFFESDSFPYMNKAFLFDSTNPGLFHPPTDTNAIKNWLENRWDDAEMNNWAWKPENSMNRLWPLEENLSYTNDTLLTAGMNGFPLGDLFHWFPEKYQEWKMQEHDEKARIQLWLDTGKDPGVINFAEQPKTVLPHNYVLHQNYPNPFNPTTIINYELPITNHVDLNIYDVLGEKVTALVSRVQRVGRYTIEWDASGLASGIYYYELRAGNFRDVKKMLLVK